MLKNEKFHLTKTMKKLPMMKRNRLNLHFDLVHFDLVHFALEKRLNKMMKIFESFEWVIWGRKSVARNGHES